MDSRMFLVEKNQTVMVRGKANGELIEVAFRSIDEFYRYCPVVEYGIGLDDIWFLDYEPDRKLLVKQTIDQFEPHQLPWKEDLALNSLIADIETVMSRIADPLWCMDLAEAKAEAVEQVRARAQRDIYAACPLVKQLNIALGIKGYDTPEALAAAKAAIEAGIHQCNADEAAIASSTTIGQIRQVISAEV